MAKVLNMLSTSVLQVLKILDGLKFAKKKKKALAAEMRLNPSKIDFRVCCLPQAKRLVQVAIGNLWTLHIST